MSVFRLFSFNSLANCRSVLCSRNALLCCEEQRAAISHKVLEKLGIPAPPKKPLSPYLKFAQSIRPDIIKCEPGISACNIIKRVGQYWQECDPEKKKILQKEYLQEMESYLVESSKYKESITPEQQSLIENVKAKKKRAKELSILNNKKRSLGKPVKPVTPFIKYMLEQKQNRDMSLKYSEWMSGIGKKWEQLPETEKSKYITSAQEELKKYKEELLVWEENMLRQGHVDVVRNRDILEDTTMKKSNVNKI